MERRCIRIRGTKLKYRLYGIDTGCVLT
ncbi:hypothetical protein EYZ11_003993 [Aspergillus tanneri]|uniref:Uncharacterized protein n=1 Tax=Aspergillus tanneri TaxID=1220188 RepID=A0A4S3JLR1_9EURO|nr:hypothetical protein EYZ11_003993 [Aspergillus tanneri]